MGISHIEITWINGTVRLDHNLISAVSVLLAGFVCDSYKRFFGQCLPQLKELAYLAAAKSQT